MNEERPVEKLLRRFAKKRRDAAGSSSDMHPTTRRILQSEVARQFPKASGDDQTGVDVFVAFFARNWTYAMGIFLIFAVSFVLLTPALKENKPQVSLTSTDEKTLSVAKMDHLSTAANPTTADFAPQSTAVDSPNESRFNAVPATDSVATVTMAESAIPEANGSLDIKSKRLFGSNTEALNYSIGRSEDKRVVGDRRELRKSIQQTQLLAGGGNGNQIVESQTNQNVFRQSYANSVQLKPATASPREVSAETPPVLLNFQIEQRGNEIRVIDEDGSIYIGVADIAQSSHSKRSDSVGLAENNLLKSNGNNSAKTFQFHVAGTNRTLNQSVVFNWNYLPPANTHVSTNRRFATEEIKTTHPLDNARQFPRFQNYNLNGRVQISTGNEIEINAKPVGH